MDTTVAMPDYAITEEIRTQIRILEELKKKYPLLQYTQRGKSNGKMYDINVSFYGKRFLVLNSKPNTEMGRFYTNSLTTEEKKSSIPDTTRTTEFLSISTDFYYYRPKWDMKFWKPYHTHEQLIKDIEHILLIFMEQENLT